MSPRTIHRVRKSSTVAALIVVGLTAVSLLDSVPTPAHATIDQTVTFNEVGTHTITAPLGAVEMRVTAVGGAGGMHVSGTGPAGGAGGMVSATLPVTSGEPLTVTVGGNSVGGLGGYGGGAAGRNPGSNQSEFSGGGGGASDLRQGGSSLLDRVIVAGGGGGSGNWNNSGGTASGGAATGAVGGPGLGGGGCASEAGGGTQTSGGAGGASCGNPNEVAGSSGQLGTGGLSGYRDFGNRNLGGGGGGGYFGGGGGSAFGGGGAGSSYAGPTARNVAMAVASDQAPEVSITFTLGEPGSVALALSETEVVADGAATFTATATVKDALGDPLAGQSVEFESTDAGMIVGAVVDNEDGTYSAPITTSTTLGTAEVVALVSGIDGVLRSSSRTVTQISGPPALITLNLDNSDLPADGVATIGVQIRLTDAQGHATNPMGPIIVDSTDPEHLLTALVPGGTGVWNATLTASTTAGESTISARTPHPNGMLVSAPHTLTQFAGVASGVDAGLGDATLVADGAAQTTLTVRPTDQHQNTAEITDLMIDPGASGVTVSAPSLQRDGSYEAQVTASTTARIAVLDISGRNLDGVRIATEVHLDLRPGAPADISAELDDAALIADGSSETELKFAISDAHGNRIAGLAPEVLTSDAGQHIGAVRDLGDGDYAVTVRSSQTLGTVTLTVNSAASGATATTTIDLRHIADVPAEVGLQLAASNGPADGANGVRISATVLDRLGHPTDAPFGVAFASTDSGHQFSAPTRVSAGVYETTLTVSTLAGDAIIEVSLPGMTQRIEARATFTQSVGPVATLVGNLDDSELVADGMTKTQLRFKATDAYGNPVVGQPFTVAGSDPDLGIGAVQDAGDGSYSVPITSTNRAGTVKITVSAPLAAEVSQAFELTLVAGVPAVATLALDPASIVADGETTTQLTAKVADAHGNPVSGAALRVVSTDLGQRSTELVAGDDAGTYTAEIRASQTVGDATLAVVTAAEPATPLGSTNLKQVRVPVPNVDPDPEVSDAPKSLEVPKRLTATGFDSTWVLWGGVLLVGLGAALSGGHLLGRWRRRDL